jgi:DNA-binding IclR family transcriptional regulator
MDVLANDSESGRDSNKATARILKVFSSFASDAAKFGVTELSHQLGMTKNMVHRALQTLADQGYLMRDASGSRYQLSYRVLELQNHGVMEPDFRTLCQPYVQAIYRLTGETVSVLVRSLDYAVFIDGVETRKTGVWRMPIGGLRPLHSTASGRAMLAYSSDDDIDDYIRRHRPMRFHNSEETISGPELWQEIKAIRGRGYAIMRRGGNLPMYSLAFPIMAAEGRVHGVISVGGPEERFKPEVPALLPRLLEIVEELRGRARLYATNQAGTEIN